VASEALGPVTPLLLPAALAGSVGLAAFGHDSAATEPRLDPRLITLRRPTPRLLTPTRELQTAALAFPAKRPERGMTAAADRLDSPPRHQPGRLPVADHQFGGGEVHDSGYARSYSEQSRANSTPSSIGSGNPMRHS
jgi:hypothetical protein